MDWEGPVTKACSSCPVEETRARIDTSLITLEGVSVVEIGAGEDEVWESLDDGFHVPSLWREEEERMVGFSFLFWWSGTAIPWNHGRYPWRSPGCCPGPGVSRYSSSPSSSFHMLWPTGAVAK